MRKVPVLLLLSRLIGIGTRAEAQFSYHVENVNQIYQPQSDGYYGGFTATLLMENINTYNDPTIISFRSLYLAVSPRVMSYCALYDLAREICNISGSGLGTQGSVQTGTIPIANSFWIYTSGVSEDSCIQFCYAKRYELGSEGFGVLGCQGPAPTPDFYSGRTCDADGFTGYVSMNMTFRYFADASVPVFTFDETDLTALATELVWSGRNAFVPVVTPEPSSWLLMGTGIGFVAAAARRRKSGVKAA